MVKKNILNTVSKYLLTVVVIVIMSIIIYPIVANTEKTSEYNFVELQMRFKRYTLIDKYEESNKYIFILENPITKETTKVAVTLPMYMNVYFVGDTIK